MSEYGNESAQMNADLRLRLTKQAKKENTGKSTILRKAVDEYCDSKEDLKDIDIEGDF